MYHDIKIIEDVIGMEIRIKINILFASMRTTSINKQNLTTPKYEK